MKSILVGALVLMALSSPVFSANDFTAEITSMRALLTEMILVDTSDGNESRVVKLIEKRLEAESIPYQKSEFGPGHESIVARLKGSGEQRPLLLMAHTDVVGTKDQKWTSDPHTLIEKDGYLVGRGSSDDLGMAAMELEVFIGLKKSGVKLRRDVILALTAGEETSGGGVIELLKNHPEWIDAEIAINEGGTPEIGEDGKVKFVTLQTAEKTYRDFEIITKGVSGHSSVPSPDNAINRLAAALNKLAQHPHPIALMPVTRIYFERRAALSPPKLASAMRAASKAQGAIPVWALKELEKDPQLGAMLRTTCVATLVQGGTKENALPPEARANVNCRILPSETPEEVQSRLVKIIADPKVEVRAKNEFGVGGSSPVTGEFPTAVQKIVKSVWGDAPVIPFVSLWATDSRYLRQKGVAAYGMDPIAMSATDERRAHGIDERIPVASLRPGFQFLQGLVLELAGPRPASR